MLPDWRIYYTGSETFSSLDGPASAAPSRGFLCAIGYDQDGSRYIMHGGSEEKAGESGYWDYFRYDPATAQFWGHDLAGLLDWAAEIGFVTGITPGNPSVIHTTAGDFDRVGFVETMRLSKGVFIGRTVTKSAWAAALEAAHKDPDFPYGMTRAERDQAAGG